MYTCLALNVKGITSLIHHPGHTFVPDAQHFYAIAVLRMDIMIITQGQYMDPIPYKNVMSSINVEILNGPRLDIGTG